MNPPAAKMETEPRGGLSPILGRLANIPIRPGHGPFGESRHGKPTPPRRRQGSCGASHRFRGQPPDEKRFRSIYS